MGVTRLADLPENGPASINCSDFLLSNHTVEPASLRTKVSVAGKRNFAGRDKGAETAPEDQGDHCRDMTAPLIPPIRRYLRRAGKSPLARKCVVGLRGLELRARHAVLSNRSLSRPQCCKRGRKVAP